MESKKRLRGLDDVDGVETPEPKRPKFGVAQPKGAVPSLLEICLVEGARALLETQERKASEVGPDWSKAERKLLAKSSFADLLGLFQTQELQTSVDMKLSGTGRAELVPKMVERTFDIVKAGVADERKEQARQLESLARQAEDVDEDIKNELENATDSAFDDADNNFEVPRGAEQMRWGGRKLYDHSSRQAQLKLLGRVDPSRRGRSTCVMRHCRSSRFLAFPICVYHLSNRRTSSGFWSFMVPSAFDDNAKYLRAVTPVAAGTTIDYVNGPEAMGIQTDSCIEIRPGTVVDIYQGYPSRVHVCSLVAFVRPKLLEHQTPNVKLEFEGQGKKQVIKMVTTRDVKGYEEFVLENNI
jgi:hypothetical protein